MTATKFPNAELLESGQALVHSLAMRIFSSLPTRTNLDDLIAYGQVGLLQAAEEYDPAQGAQFTTYAYYRVQGAIYDGVSKMSWTSRARMNKQRKESEARLLAEQQQGQTAAPMLASTAGRERVVSIHDKKDDASVEFIDPNPTPAAFALDREVLARLMELVEKLPPIERRLIKDIYFEGLSLQEAASQQGISKSWASRVHARTLDELGRALRRIGAGDE